MLTLSRKTFTGLVGFITRDLEAAEAFLKQAKETVGHKPEKITTDRHDSYPKNIRSECGVSHQPVFK